MTLGELDRASLGTCCASSQWVDAMLARRPFADRKTLLAAADSLWWGLQPSDWLEAFSAHPKIGEKNLSGWCSQEQSGVHSAGLDVLERLAKGNQEYQQRFGWVFLIKATGKTAPEILDALEARLENEKEHELHVAACEQAKITRLRLEKLLGL